MTKFVDSLGLKRLVTKIAEAVSNGTWLPVRRGSGNNSTEEGATTTASGDWSHAEGDSSTASGYASHAEGQMTIASGDYSHAEGEECEAIGDCSHAEGQMATASGFCSHAQGYYSYDDASFIDMVGVGGGDNAVSKNASVIYVGRTSTGTVDPTDSKNGYQYLLDVGGYKGQAIGTDTKSVQEVIADLEKGVEAASETMTVEDIREIMSV